MRPLKRLGRLAYKRPPGSKQGDFQAAREFEEEVGGALGDWKVANLSSPDRLDFWVPGFYVEVKEKRQPLTARWHQLEGCPEEDLVVLDELGYRRVLGHWPEAYVVIRDVPQGRIFLASCVDLACAERKQLMREHKGKLLFDLKSFRQIESLDQIREVVMSDLIAMPWKQSGSVSQKEVKQV